MEFSRIYFSYKERGYCVDMITKGHIYQGSKYVFELALPGIIRPIKSSFQKKYISTNPKKSNSIILSKY